MLNKLSKEIYEGNKAKMFWPENPNDRNKGELLMLITSELAEALEADRDGHYAKQIDMEQLDQIWAAHEQAGDKETKEHYRKMWIEQFKSKIKNTYQDELADSLIRILDHFGGFGFDTEWHVTNKLRYNKTRPSKHGRAY